MEWLALQLKENFNTLQTAVMSAKPNSFKGKYLKSVVISSTLGPGIKIGIEKLCQVIKI